MKRPDGSEKILSKWATNLRFTTKLNFLDTNPVIDEARFWRLGPLGSNHQFYEFGASMRRLGYHPLYALGRLAKYYSTGILKGRRGSLYISIITSHANQNLVATIAYMMSNSDIL
ncbi:MAG TPA: hypothetical protein VH500_01380 [Nitrososphaeraceae archaeon]